MEESIGQQLKNEENILMDRLLVDWSRNLILDHLSPTEVACLSLVSKKLVLPVELWCQTVGLNQIVDCQLSRLAIYKTHPVTKDISFNVYTKFLYALLNAPLQNEIVNLKSWKCRYIAASRPRPRRFGALGNVTRGEDRFDWGYPGGYWCEAIGNTNQGKANDYFRLVGGNPTWWALCAAGSDGGQYARWDLETKPKAVEHSTSCYIQSPKNTNWDKVFTWWYKCGNFNTGNDI